MDTNKTEPQETSPIVSADIAQSKVSVSTIETGSEAKPIRIKGNLATPNALLKDGNKVLLGDQAMNRALLNPGKLVVAFKRRLLTAPRAIIGESGLTPYDCLKVILLFIIAALKKNSPVIAKAIGDGTCRWVLTVPSWFDEQTKKLYFDISDELGINLKSLVTEPIAALTNVLSQYPNRISDGDIALTVDIGASTSDFEGVERRSGEFHQIVGSQGIDIGGVDLTGELYVHLCKKHGYDELAKCYRPRDGFDYSGVGLTLDQQLVAMKLAKAAEALKIGLSSDETETLVDIPGIGILECSIDKSTARKLWAPLFDEICKAVSAIAGELPKSPDHLVVVGGGALTPDLSDLLALAAGVDMGRVIAVCDSVNVISNGAAESLATSSLGGTVLSRGIGVMVKDPTTNEDVGVILAEEGQRIPREGFRIRNDGFYALPRNGIAALDLRCIEAHKGIRPRECGGRLVVPANKTSPLGTGRAEFKGLPNQRQRMSLDFSYTNKNPEFAIYPVGSNLEPQRVSLLKDDVAKENSMPLHLVILLDVSTSMGVDLGKVQEGVSSLIPGLVSQEVAISLVVFGSEAETLVANSSSESDLRRAVEGLATSGSTNMAAALRQAEALVVNDSQNVVFLYTDGRPNSSAESVEAAKCLRAHVDRVATFGIGSLADHDLLRTQIASSSDDHFEGLSSDIPLAISSVVDLYLIENQSEVEEVSA